jgi:OPA family sugar phosphate sensor protein UhpC-like MFS transporter
MAPTSRPKRTQVAVKPKETDARSTSEKLRWLQIRAFSLTWVSYASYYFTRKNLAVVKSHLHEHLGITTFQLGCLDTAYLAAYAVGQFASGVIGDVIGPRLLLSFGMLGSAVMAASFGLSSTFLPMFLAFAVNGLFQSTGWSGNVKAIQPFLHSSYRGSVMGWWTTNYQVGGLLATALATLLLTQSGWRAAFCLPALWVAAVGLAIYFLLVEKPQDRGLPPVEVEPAAKAQASVSSRGAGSGFFMLLRSPLLLSLGGAYFGLKLIRYSLLFWLPYYLHERLHYSESQAGYGSLPFELGGIVGSIVIGVLSDRYCRSQRLRLAVPALIFLGGALFAYQLLGGLGLLYNALLLSAIGFLLFGPDSLLSGTVSQEIGGYGATARVAGIINGMGSIGAIFSPLIVAWTSERFGWGVLFMSFVGTTLVSALLLLTAQLLQGKSAMTPAAV